MENSQEILTSLALVYIEVVLPLVFGVGKLAASISSDGSRAYVGPLCDKNGEQCSLDAANTVVLGGLFPLHGESKSELEDTSERYCDRTVQMAGFQRMEAMRMAVEEINKNDRIPGVKLAYDMRDTCHSKRFTLQQVVHLLSRGRGPSCSVNTTANVNSAVSAVVGAAVSGPSIDVANLLRLFEIPQISYASTSVELSDSKRYKFFLRTVPSDNFQARAIVSLARALNISYLSLLHSSGAYGEGGATAIRREIKKSGRGMCLATDKKIGNILDAFALASYKSASEDLTQERSKSASVAVLFSKPKDVFGFLSVLGKQLGVVRSRPRAFTWIASDAWGGHLLDHPSVTKQPDVRVVFQRILKGMLGISPQSTVVGSFKEHFLALHPNNSIARENPWLIEFWEQEFNCSLVKDADACLSNSLRSDRGSRKYKQDPKVAFVIDAVDAIAGALRELQAKFCQGKRGLCPEMLTQALNSRQGAVDGNKLLQALEELRLNSSTGHFITFTPDGDLATSVYDIRNLHVTGSGVSQDVTVGSWERLPDKQFPLGVTVSKNGEVVSVECEDLRDELTTTLNCTRVRLRLNLSAVQWHNGASGLSGVPLSRCSANCAVGHTAEPRYPLLKDLEGCCWHCVKCEENWYTPSQGEKCRECSIRDQSTANQSSCVALQRDYWSADTTLTLLSVSLTCLSSLLVLAMAGVLLKTHHLPSWFSLSRVSLSCSLTGAACIFIVQLALIRPGSVLCTVKVCWIGLSLTLLIAPIFAEMVQEYLQQRKTGSNSQAVAAPSATRDTAMYLSQESATSPGQEKTMPPDLEAGASPSQQTTMSPSREAVPFPTQEMATTPDQETATSPSSEIASIPSHVATKAFLSSSADSTTARHSRDFNTKRRRSRSLSSSETLRRLSQSMSSLFLSSSSYSLHILISLHLLLEGIVLMLSTAALGMVKVKERIHPHKQVEESCDLDLLVLWSILPNVLLMISMVFLHFHMRRSGIEVNRTLYFAAMVMAVNLFVAVLFFALFFLLSSLIYKTAVLHFCLLTMALSVLCFILLPDMRASLSKNSHTPLPGQLCVLRPKH